MLEILAHLTVNLAKVDHDDGLDVEGLIDQKCLELGEMEQLKPAGPLACDLHLSRIGEELLVRGRLDLRCDCVCARCAKDYQETFSESDYCESYDISQVNDYFDLTESVRESIILALPTYPICQEDCKGLCLKCGVDLNTSTCTCNQQEDDSCWAELDKMSNSVDSSF